MPHVIWTPEALRDVRRLYQFLAPKNRLVQNGLSKPFGRKSR